MDNSKKTNESSMTQWVFKSRSNSDFRYVFFSHPFLDEASARKAFEKAKAHAKKHGGAGSLHEGSRLVASFSEWCPND